MLFVFLKSWPRLSLAASLLGGGLGSWAAEEQKPMQPPKIAAISPLSLFVDRTNMLSIRGFNLKDTTEVRLSLGAFNLIARIKDKKDAVTIKGLEAKDTGDHWLTAEVFIPTDRGPTNGVVSLSVKNSAGETAPLSRRLIDPSMLSLEREPNGGFKTAQKLTFDSQIVLVASIQPEHDVDVFEITGRRGQSLALSFRPADFSSFLDPIVTVYNARLEPLAALDDTGPKPESERIVGWSEDGSIFVVVQDANEHASDWHGYELKMNRQ